MGKKRDNNSKPTGEGNGGSGGGGDLFQQLDSPRSRDVSSVKGERRNLDLSLHVACGSGNVAAVKRIVESQKGRSANWKDYEGRRPLHVTAARGNTAITKYLLNVDGIDVNAKDDNNRTPLMVAPAENKELIHLLTTSGAVEDASYFECEQPNEVARDNKMESAEVVDTKFMRKVFLVFCVPFVYLLFANGLFFALKFVFFTLLFYFSTVGYFVSEITIKPPWYHHHPGAKLLTLKNLPDYWGGCIHNPKHNLKLDYMDITFKSTDGYTLSAWYIPGKTTKTGKGKGKGKGKEGQPGKQTGILLVHGGGRDRRAWLRHVPLLHEQGYSCLLFDFREHGLSSGACRGFTYGMGERHDVLAAARFLRDEFKHPKVVAMGTSVGGSSVIMAAAMEASLIHGVIAENPITTCAHLQDKHIVNLFGGYFKGTVWSNLVFALFRRGCMVWLNIRVGNKPSKHCQALHVIGKLAPRPVLLMHGTYDEVVPHYHSERLFEHANEPKELWLCPGAHHCMLQNTDKPEFDRRVLGYLDQHSFE